MSLGNDRGRPRQESAPSMVTTTANSMTPGYADVPLFVQDEHGALVAADAAPGHLVNLLETTIIATLSDGRHAASDEIQAPLGAVCTGPWVGGVYLRLAKSGRIHAVGYRRSSKPSRAGAIVTVWAAGGEAS